MLDEDRIRVMTKLAVLEKEKGKQIELASRYYKNDYMSYHMIWAAIAATAAFVLICGLVAVYHMEYYLNNIHKLHLSSIGILILFLYAGFLICFEIVAWFIYRKRYQDAQRCLKEYCKDLKELEKIYNKGYYKHEQMKKQKSLKTKGASDDNFTGN